LILTPRVEAEGGKSDKFGIKSEQAKNQILVVQKYLKILETNLTKLRRKK
jgi:hypothetical protein